MIPRIFHPSELASGQIIPLPEAQRHYLVRVMRLGNGQPVTLFNGDGYEWQGQISSLGPPLQITIQSGTLVVRESPLAITLVQGICRASAMDLVIQKGVELGVARMVPLICRRGRHEGGNVERWRRIAAEAAEQCGRTRLPDILPPTPWDKLPPLLTDTPRWLFWEEQGYEKHTVLSLANSHSKPPGITLIIGPEGGFCPEEVAAAQQTLACLVVGLGPRTMRCETAALTAVAALQLLWGDLS